MVQNTIHYSSQQTSKQANISSCKTTLDHCEIMCGYTQLRATPTKHLLQVDKINKQNKQSTNEQRTRTKEHLATSLVQLPSWWFEV